MRATMTEDWCKICEGSAIDPVSTPCGQVYCKSCIWMLPLYQERMLRDQERMLGHQERMLRDQERMLRDQERDQERMLRDQERMSGDCPICMGGLTKPVSTACGHWYCKECLESWLCCGYSTCPMCVRNVVDFKEIETPPVYNFRIPKNTEELYLDILCILLNCFHMVVCFFGLQKREVVYTSIRGLPMVYRNI